MDDLYEQLRQKLDAMTKGYPRTEKGRRWPMRGKRIPQKWSPLCFGWVRSGIFRGNGFSAISVISSRGTIAEGAEILILPDPVVCRCSECNADFEIDRDAYAGEDIFCPACARQNYTLISGTKFQIEGIEVI